MDSQIFWVLYHSLMNLNSKLKVLLPSLDQEDIARQVMSRNHSIFPRALIQPRKIRQQNSQPNPSSYFHLLREWTNELMAKSRTNYL